MTISGIFKMKIELSKVTLERDAMGNKTPFTDYKCLLSCWKGKSKLSCIKLNVQ